MKLFFLRLTAISGLAVFCILLFPAAISHNIQKPKTSLRFLGPSDAIYGILGDVNSDFDVDKTDWDQFDINGRRFSYKDDFWHGPFKQSYKNGKTHILANYQFYRLVGPVTVFYTSGQRKHLMHYEKGYRNGQFYSWHPNGIKQCEATFLKGKLHGTWKKWDTDGKIVKVIHYRQGRITKEEPPKSKTPLDYPGVFGSADFALNLSQGGFEGGYDTLRISSTGSCEVVCRSPIHGVSFPDGKKPIPYIMGGWRRSKFQLTEKEQIAVRDGIRAVAPFTLDDEYDAKFHDGTHWFFSIRVGGKTKSVHCANKFPLPLVEFSKVVWRHVILPHRNEVQTGSRVEFNGIASDNWLENPI